MSAYLKLILAYLKIGLFGFGGGYAMLSLIQREVVGAGWITNTMFTDIVAISQMTPGPIAINSATYIGYTVLQGTGVCRLSDEIAQSNRLLRIRKQVCLVNQVGIRQGFPVQEGSNVLRQNRLFHAHAAALYRRKIIIQDPGYKSQDHQSNAKNRHTD